MAGTANSITSHNSLRGVLNANNVIAGGVGTAFDSTYSIIAETGAQIALSISSTDYKMQATLKDKYGNVIYTSNIIDLPLETMVVNARYDSNTKEVVLILDNGNELRFSVADLVDGLVSTDQLNSVLTDYVKNTDYATSSKGGVFKTSSGFCALIDSGFLRSDTKTYSEYGNLSTNAFISKGTLENVITGKGLVSNTDYATSSTGGVVKTASTYATGIGNGFLYAQTKTNEQYTSGDNAMFISKGTLENVLNAKIGNVETLLEVLDIGSGARELE